MKRIPIALLILAATSVAGLYAWPRNARSSRRIRLPACRRCEILYPIPNSATPEFGHSLARLRCLPIVAPSCRGRRNIQASASSISFRPLPALDRRFGLAPAGDAGPTPKRIDDVVGIRWPCEPACVATLSRTDRPASPTIPPNLREKPSPGPCDVRGCWPRRSAWPGARHRRGRIPACRRGGHGCHICRR